MTGGQYSYTVNGWTIYENKVDKKILRYTKKKLERIKKYFSWRFNDAKFNAIVTCVRQQTAVPLVRFFGTRLRSCTSNWSMSEISIVSNEKKQKLVNKKEALVIGTPHTIPKNGNKNKQPTKKFFSKFFARKKPGNYYQSVRRNVEELCSVSRTKFSTNKPQSFKRFQRKWLNLA